MINQWTQLITGFSVFALIILLVAYLFFLPDIRKNLIGKLSCCVLLLSLSAIQYAHFEYLHLGLDLLKNYYYCFTLLWVPPSFYYFSRVILFFELSWKPIDLLHLVTPSIGMFLPLSILPIFAFIVGTGYTAWIAYAIYGVRDQRSRFKFEIFFFGLFALMAISALILGISIPYIGSQIFLMAYANAIGFAVVLIVTALIVFPKLTNDLIDIANIAYSNSKLIGVDIEAKKQQLEHLMSVEKLYQNESLSLTLLAEVMELSSHQLSEMINTHYQIGFSRYIREKRVTEAKKLLIEEPDSSVLAISLETGFRSQSSFYTAFHEVCGVSPGAFRKKHAL